MKKILIGTLLASNSIAISQEIDNTLDYQNYRKMFEDSKKQFGDKAVLECSIAVQITDKIEKKSTSKKSIEIIINEKNKITINNSDSVEILKNELNKKFKIVSQIDTFFDFDKNDLNSFSFSYQVSYENFEKINFKNNGFKKLDSFWNCRSIIKVNN